MEKATPPKGSNAKTDAIVLNFICLIGTYDKKPAQVVSANIGGPRDRWVRKMNARERKDCIINIGEENKKEAQRMEAAIDRIKIQGGKGTFSLAIEETKVAQGRSSLGGVACAWIYHWQGITPAPDSN